MTEIVTLNDIRCNDRVIVLYNPLYVNVLFEEGLYSINNDALSIYVVDCLTKQEALRKFQEKFYYDYEFVSTEVDANLTDSAIAKKRKILSMVRCVEMPLFGE